MRKLKPYLFLISGIICLSVNAQKLQHDWENYIVSLNGKPVSINVDLGLKPQVPVADLPFVIIARLKLNNVDQWGMPDQSEMNELDKVEEKMVENLNRFQGAVYVGRFTQRGIREYYFYSNDTSRYQSSIGSVFLESSNFKWLAQAKKDADWENYLTVLYPSTLDLILIESRKKVDENARKNMKQLPVSVLHYFEFQKEADCKAFLQLPVCGQYKVVQMQRNSPASTIALLISATVVADRRWAEKTIPVLFSESKKHGGLYKGWEIGQ
jgi:uncharacterized protein (TIGR01619 family)